MEEKEGAGGGEEEGEGGGEVRGEGRSMRRGREGGGEEEVGGGEGGGRRRGGGENGHTQAYTHDANLVAVLQVKVTGLWVVAEINALPVITDDVLCSGILVLSPGNQLMHPASGSRRPTLCDVYS